MKKWDRRTWMKVVVGGALGLGASPLMPKLTDDSAIWTQNWNWVPSPERGELAFAATVNPETSTACRLRIIHGRMQGDRLIRLDGNPEHPLTGQGAVPADIASLQLLYTQDMRSHGPSYRDRRTGRHTQIGWEKALEILGQKLGAATDKPQEVLVLGGRGDDTVAHILRRFCAALGTPNLAFEASATDTLALAGQLMFGQPELGFDLMNADHVICFGSPLLEGFGAPVATRQAFAAWRGYPDHPAKYVQVDCRASVSASQADQWVAVRPGTEGALALGLCAALVTSGKHNQAFANATQGFGEFQSMLLAEYTPAKVAEITGVEAETIKKMAQEFAAAPAGLAVIGPNNSGGPGRLLDFMAVLALNGLKGNLGQKGGVVVRQAAPLAPLGDELPAPTNGALAPAGPLGQPSQVALCQAALAKGGVDVVISVGGNPAFAGPGTNQMREMMRQSRFVVAITPYNDETAALADLVLPAAHFLESFGDCGTPYGLAQASYGLHRPLVLANPQAKGAGDIILSLAAQMGGAVAEALPAESMEDALTKRTAEMGDFEELSGKSFWLQEAPAYGAMELKTASGQVELNGAAGMPRWVNPLGQGHGEEGHGAEGGHGGGTLVMQGIPSLRTPEFSTPMAPYQQKVLADTVLANRDQLVVEMNPQTAHDLGLGQGDQIEVASEAGSVFGLVHLFGGVAPGMVAVPRGLGHSAFGFYLKGRGDNFYAAAQASTDHDSGLAQWDLTKVAIKKVTG